MEAKVTWNTGLSFNGFSDSGVCVPLSGDADQENTFRPMQLIAIALAGCTAMDTISILQKKKQQVSAFEVQVQAERADEHPKVFTHILLDFIVTGQQIDPVAVERAIQLSSEKYCPAQAMLKETVLIKHKVTIREE